MPNVMVYIFIFYFGIATEKHIFYRFNGMSYNEILYLLIYAFYIKYIYSILNIYCL